MSVRTWLLFLTVMNVIVFLPAGFMAFSAVNLARENPGSGLVAGIAFLFVALPVFCLVAPLAAWRVHDKRREDLNAVLTVAAPLVYAAFLVVFLLAN